jgi:Zn-dependent protease with chaperone function
MELSSCKFHDGNSSNRYEVSVRIVADGINISDKIFWKFSDIIIVENPIDNRSAILSNIDISDARLYIHDKNFFDQIKKHIPKFHLDKKESVSFIKEFSGLIAAFSLVIILTFFGLEFLSARITDENLKKIGDSAVMSITKGYSLTCKNNDGNLAIKNLVDKISADSHYQIYIVKSQEINAFILSNKTIIINSALLDKLYSANQLTMVLAHEIGHIKAQHHKRLLAATSLISGMIGDYPKAVSYLLSLKYSRDDEIEADIFAYDFAIKNSINPKDLIAVFEIIKKQNIASEKFLSYISTHPATDERIILINKKMANQKFISRDFISKESWGKIKNICL